MPNPSEQGIIEIVMQAYRAWTGKQLPEESISLIGLGEHNISSIVRDGDREVVGRVAIRSAPKRFEDAQREAALLQRLNGTSVAPELHHLAADVNGYPVIFEEYVNGQPFLDGDVHKSYFLLGQTLGRLHSLQISNIAPSPKLLSEGQLVDLDEVIGNLIQTQGNYTDLIRLTQDCRTAMLSYVAKVDQQNGLVLVHSDVGPGNCVKQPGRIVLLDWEYAGLGHPNHDLADALYATVNGQNMDPLEENVREDLLRGYKSIRGDSLDLTDIDDKLVLHFLWDISWLVGRILKADKQQSLHSVPGAKPREYYLNCLRLTINYLADKGILPERYDTIR